MNLYLNNFSSYGVKIGDILEIPARKTDPFKNMDISYIQDTFNNISKIEINEEELVGSHLIDFVSIFDEPEKEVLKKSALQ